MSNPSVGYSESPKSVKAIVLVLKGVNYKAVEATRPV